MSESFNVWPPDVTQSYAGAGFPLPDERPSVLLRNFDPTSEFFVAFLAGAAFVTFFSIAKFNHRSADLSDPVTKEYQILRQLTPWEMREGRLMLQAYALYVAVLLTIYFALTFYGRWIVEVVNATLPTAGFSPDVGKFDMTSPNWPLFVALSMIGVLPVLKPIELVEVRLRRWTHRTVGIPLTIYENVGNLQNHIRKMLRGESTEPGPIHGWDVPTWLRERSTDKVGVDYAFEARDQLERLVQWIKYGRGPWPSVVGARALENLIDGELNAAVVAIGDFDDIVTKDFAKAPRRTGSKPQESLLTHQTRLERDWGVVSASVVKHRDELLALLAIAAEKGPEFGKIDDPELRKLMQDSIGDRTIQRGPVIALLMMLVPILIAYYAMVTAGYHPPIGDTALVGVSTDVLTALIDTAKVACLFVIPTTVALNYRFLRKKVSKWHELKLVGTSQRMYIHAFVVAGIAAVVSFGMLALLSVTQAMILAEDSTRYHQILFEKRFPIFPINVGMVGIAVIQSLAVVYVVGVKERGGFFTLPKLILTGIVSATLVFVYQATHMYFWTHEVLPLFPSENPDAHWLRSCSGQDMFLVDLLKTDPMNGQWKFCFLFYNTTSYIIYAALAFLSATVFLPDMKQFSDSGASEEDDSSPDGRPVPYVARRVALWAVTIIFAGLVGAAAMAQGSNKPGPEQIVVGFRKSAEPFSYVEGLGKGQRYAGYLVDLCTEIFKAPVGDPEYEMVITEVTAQDRFVRLRRNPGAFDSPEKYEAWRAELGGKPQVDLLCDPVTLRYSGENGTSTYPRTDGVFSPIVYVTGVSYMVRSTATGKGKPQIGFVGGTTAEVVVRQACERDAFRRVRKGKVTLETTRCSGENSLSDEISLLMKLWHFNKEKTGLDESGGVMCGSQFNEGIYNTWADWALRAGQGRKESPDTEKSEPDPESLLASGNNKPLIFESPYDFCVADNHEALISWFCDGDPETPRYYFGDKDLIVGKLAARKRDRRPCDNVEQDDRFFSYEPYALLISSVNPDIIRFVQRRVYEIFSDRDRALGFFAVNFEGKQMSKPLANLFLLNAVEDKADFASHPHSNVDVAAQRANSQ